MEVMRKVNLGLFAEHFVDKSGAPYIPDGFDEVGDTTGLKAVDKVFGVVHQSALEKL